MKHIKLYEEYNYIDNNLKEFVDFLLDFMKEKSGVEFRCPYFIFQRQHKYKFAYNNVFGLPNWLYSLENIDYESGEDDRYFSFELNPEIMKIRKHHARYGEYFEPHIIIVLGLFIKNIMMKYIKNQNMIPQSSITEIKNELLKIDYEAFSKKEIQNLMEEEEILKASRDFNL